VEYLRDGARAEAPPIEPRTDRDRALALAVHQEAERERMQMVEDWQRKWLDEADLRRRVRADLESVALERVLSRNRGKGTQPGVERCSVERLAVLECLQSSSSAGADLLSCTDVTDALSACARKQPGV